MSLTLADLDRRLRLLEQAREDSIAVPNKLYLNSQGLVEEPASGLTEAEVIKIIEQQTELKLPCGHFHCEAGKLFWQPSEGAAIEIGGGVTSASMKGAYAAYAWGGTGETSNTKEGEYVTFGYTNSSETYEGKTYSLLGPVNNLLGPVTESHTKENLQNANWSTLVGVTASKVLEGKYSKEEQVTARLLHKTAAGAETTLATQVVHYSSTSRATVALSATTLIAPGDAIYLQLAQQYGNTFLIVGSGSEAAPGASAVQLVPGS